MKMINNEDSQRFKTWRDADLNVAQAMITQKVRKWKIPKRPKIEPPDKSLNKNMCGLKLLTCESSCPIAAGERLDENAVLIVHTEATFDVGSIGRALKVMPGYIRELLKGINFKAASSAALSEYGLRFRANVWDADQDRMFMTKSPNLLSVGARCLRAGMTFVWVYSCSRASYLLTQSTSSSSTCGTMCLLTALRLKT